MKKKTKRLKVPKEPERFPALLFVTRTDEDTDHYFNVSESKDEVDTSDGPADTAVYKRVQRGTVTEKKTISFKRRTA